jgi:hypothetical protein
LDGELIGINHGQKANQKEDQLALYTSDTGSSKQRLNKGGRQSV